MGPDLMLICDEDDDEDAIVTAKSNIIQKMHKSIYTLFVNNIN